MPEAMYFFVFWVFSWFVLSYLDSSPLILGGGAGLILGILAMIKAHGIFLLGSFAFFALLGWVFCLDKVTLRRTLELIACAIAGFLLIRLPLGFLIAGKEGMHLLGELYGSYATSAVKGSRYLSELKLARYVLYGHLLGLSALLGVPLASIASMTRQSHHDTHDDKHLRIIQLFALTSLATLLVIVVLFSAHIGAAYDLKEVARLHMRYYDFMFPLLFIIAAAHISSGASVPPKSWRTWSAVLPVAILAMQAIRVLVKRYHPITTDCPELRGFTVNHIAFVSLAVLGLLSLLVWGIRRTWGASLYVFVFLPLTMVTSSHYVFKELRQGYRTENIYDSAPLFARRYLSNEVSQLVIAASDRTGLYRAQFHIDNPDAATVELPAGAALEAAQIPPGKNWILLIGDHKVHFPVQYELSMGEYSIIRLQLKNGNEIDFSRTFWPGLLRKVRGLDRIEDFGRWSNGDEVEIEYLSPLPQKFVLSLEAFAFGPNIGQPFKICIGSQEQEFRYDGVRQWVPELKSFPFQMDGTEKIIRIKIPRPTAPKDFFGTGTDERRLGIALHKLRITDVHAEPTFDIDFRQQALPNRSATITGMSEPETFGRWSTSEQVHIEYVHPLPKQFKLYLTAWAFGPVADQPFKINIGQQERTFHLRPATQEISYLFMSAGKEKKIIISIPKPLSPKALGISSDERRLGIAIQQLRIEDVTSGRK